MGTLNIQFQGICTHFAKLENLGLPVSHRVVLVNASRPYRLGGIDLPPHFASLQTPGLAVALAGCTLRVQNPSPLLNDYHLSYLGVIPVLTELMLGSGAPLGPPSAAVLLGQNPLLAACYFDIESGGRFSACISDGAVTTQLTIETADSPDSPVQLDLIPFPTAPFPPPAASQLTFESGSTVVVQNVSLDETNADYHFYLSYLTAQVMPDQPQLPLELAEPLCNFSVIAGPGCSNSNYP